MINFKRSVNCGGCSECNNKSPLFNSLSSEELEIINKDRFEVTYKSGEMIFKQGTASTHILMLTSGLVKIYLEGYNSKNLLLKVIKPPRIFGALGIYFDNRNYYTATALENSTVCFVSVDNFKQCVRSNPDFAEKFIEHLNRNSVYAFGRFVDLTQKQMPGRVADALLYLANEVYESNPFKISLSRQDLAEMTSLSKESFIRILKEFKEENIIKMNGDFIEISKMDALKKISQVG